MFSAKVTLIFQDSMTGITGGLLISALYEREHPEVINGSRRKRIADGSGTSIPEVNRLLKQFEGTRKLMKGAMDGSLASKLRRR